MAPRTRKYLNRVYVGAALVLAVPVIGILVWHVFLKPPPTIQSVLRDAGYLELLPPSRIHGPGTLNTVEPVAGGSVFLHLACNANVEDLLTMAKVSPIADVSELHTLSQGFDVTASAKKALASSKHGVRNIKRVRIEFVGSKIYLLPHETLLNLQDRFLIGNCEKAIIMNLENGASICQSEAVLETQVNYKVEVEDGVSGEAKAALETLVNGSAAVNEKVVGTRSLSGGRLFYGVKFMDLGLSLGDQRRANCRRLDEPSLWSWLKQKLAI